MSDLMSGRETLEDVHFVGFPGGFANSDVLGSARGWAGAFRSNARAFQALTKFFQRPNTLSIGVCNGCQLVVALELLNPTHTRQMKMRHNASGRFESIFTSVRVEETKSVMLQPLIGSRLGIWVAHGEGRFALPEGEKAYDIALRFAGSSFPENPNGSEFNAAGVVSPDGRHLVMMPHLERSLRPWNWAYYPRDRQDEISPWLLPFTAARDWIREHVK